MMSLATIVGFILAYPINSWMVKKGIKHGMMSKSSDMKMDHGSSHEMPHLTSGQTWGYVIGTFAIFFIVMWITSLFAPINF